MKNWRLYLCEWHRCCDGSATACRLHKLDSRKRSSYVEGSRLRLCFSAICALTMCCKRAVVVAQNQHWMFGHACNLASSVVPSPPCRPWTHFATCACLMYAETISLPYVSMVTKSGRECFVGFRHGVRLPPYAPNAQAAGRLLLRRKRVKQVPWLGFSRACYGSLANVTLGTCQIYRECRSILKA